MPFREETLVGKRLTDGNLRFASWNDQGIRGIGFWHYTQIITPTPPQLIRAGTKDGEVHAGLHAGRGACRSHASCPVRCSPRQNKQRQTNPFLGLKRCGPRFHCGHFYSFAGLGILCEMFDTRISGKVRSSLPVLKTPSLPAIIIDSFFTLSLIASNISVVASTFRSSIKSLISS